MVDFIVLDKNRGTYCFWGEGSTNLWGGKRWNWKSREGNAKKGIFDLQEKGEWAIWEKPVQCLVSQQRRELPRIVEKKTNEPKGTARLVLGGKGP